MKLKVTKGQIERTFDDNTLYYELYIGYDFDSDVHITVRLYPRNTQATLFLGDTRVVVKEDKFTFDILSVMDILSRAGNLIYSTEQYQAIRMFYAKMVELDR